MSIKIRSRRFKGGASQIRKFFLILKAERRLQAAILLVLAGAIMIGFSSQYIPPFVSHETYTVDMTNNPHNIGGGSGQVEALNLYAEAPNLPIYININNTQHSTIYYTVYLINDTNLAVGFGPMKTLMSGEFNTSIGITIPNTIYHMSYEMRLTAPNGTYFMVPVTYSQTIYQYPPANYYLLAPGIIAMLAGLVLISGSMIAVHSDRARYYSHLKKLEDGEIDYLMKPTRSIGTIPWLAKVIIGLFMSAIGFVFFGHGFLYSWVGIVLIVAGVAVMLNGVVHRVYTGRF